MPLFACFSGKPPASLGEPPHQAYAAQQCNAAMKVCNFERSDTKSVPLEGSGPVSTVAVAVKCSECLQTQPQPNEDLIRLVHHLTALDGGWWSWLSEACQATCEHLRADHACISVLSAADHWATTAACAGMGAASAAGRAYSSDPRFNGSAPAVLVRTQQEDPSQLLVFRTASLGIIGRSGSAPAVAATPPPAPTLSVVPRGESASRSSTPPSLEQRSGEELPGDWQLLYEEHGLTQFAAVGLQGAEGNIVGVLSLASKGPVRPRGWSPEALHCAVALLAPHIRRAQAVLASSAMSQLHAAATFSDVVNAAAEAAVDVAAAVAHVRGQSRVAFIGEGMLTAAIFQQQKLEGEPSTSQPPLLKARRSSCEFVRLSGRAGRKAVVSAATTGTSFPRLSMDVNMCRRGHFTITAARGAVTSEPPDDMKEESWTPGQTNTTQNTHSTFTFPSSKGTCKGHTLNLRKTLLSEVLLKQVAGLCIDDCQAYTVKMKAYPRDLVLSRGAIMPLSLALATISDDNRPVMAFYVTYHISLPRPLLQLVVQELQQLLQALLPILKAKLNGGILLEYEYLRSQLRDAVKRKTAPSASAHRNSVEQLSDPCEEPRSFPPNEGRMLSFLLNLGGESNAPGTKGAPTGARAAAGEGAAACAGAAAGAGAAAAAAPGGEAALSLGPNPLPPRQGSSAKPGPVPAVPGLVCGAAGTDQPSSLAEPATPPATLAAHAHSLIQPAAASDKPADGEGGFSPPSGELSFQPPVPSLSPPQQALASFIGTITAGAGGPGAPPQQPSPHSPRCGDCGAAGAGTTEEDKPLEGDIDMELGMRGRPGSGVLLQGTCELRSHSLCEPGVDAVNRLRSRLGVRSVSFRLEAAEAPRGASKLAPLIVSMHDRLKAAQAVQMTFVRSEARKTDLNSLKLLQEIGQGGYGTVYRGTFHGTEVAVKIIKQSRLGGVQSSSNLHASSHGLALHKQNIHDAIELVASVSMSHTNIVQVPAYFMDVRMDKAEDFNLLDSVDQPSESRPFRLVHSPSLLESPAPGHESQGGVGDVAMALVLEYCDCGSLCDAILNRKFIERVTPKKPPTTGSGGAAVPPKTYLAINMRSVYLTLLEIALALRHMHSLALVHCDLKPQNVLLKSSPRDPRGFTAKLSDFGLAKMMAHDDEGQLVIDEAVASGTITHVAPEVLLGQKSLGAAVDIYAFGILMYQVLCGMKVYDKTMSASAIANSVAHRSMRPQLPNWVPASYRALAQACWQHVPSSRPTADELVRHLERALEAKRGGTSGASTANAGRAAQQRAPTAAAAATPASPQLEGQ